MSVFSDDWGVNVITGASIVFLLWVISQTGWRGIVVNIAILSLCSAVLFLPANHNWKQLAFVGTSVLITQWFYTRNFEAFEYLREKKLLWKKGRWGLSIGKKAPN